MDLWYPPDDEAPLLEWWLPLLLASAAARRQRLPWPIHFDDFRLRGRVDRDGRPAIWVFHHKDSDQELYLDATGQAYKFVPTPNGRSHGRFTKLDLRRAVFAAGLPRHVEPVWYDEPPTPRYVEPTLPLHDDDEWAGTERVDDPVEYVSARTRHAAHHRSAGVPGEPSRARRRPRPGARRGHLTLIQGGRQAG
ncbi:MAG: hypothetical protein ACJ739_03885 [Acidimicrobiales bacterium]